MKVRVGVGYLLYLTKFLYNLKKNYFSRGKVIRPELVPFRQEVVDATDIPVSREFRFFVYQAKIVGYGFYWPCLMPFSELKPAEGREVYTFVEEVAKKIPATFVSFDVGQLKSGRWVIIETGDSQFAGLSLMPVRPLWENLCKLIF